MFRKIYEKVTDAVLDAAARGVELAGRGIRAIARRVPGPERPRSRAPARATQAARRSSRPESGARV